MSEIKIEIKSEQQNITNEITANSLSKKITNANLLFEKSGKLPIFIEYIEQIFDKNDCQKVKLLFDVNVNFKNFCVDFNELYNMVGYNKKSDAKKILTNGELTENEDYVLRRSPQNYSPEETNLGGRPTEKILLTVNAAQIFSLSARTKEAAQTRRFFVNLVNVISHYSQLQKTFENYQKLAQQREQYILSKIKNGDKCFYIIDIGDNLVKIGYTSNISKRLKTHKCNFNICNLLSAIATDDYIEVEQTFKQNDFVRTREIEYKNKKNENLKEIYKIDELWNAQHIEQLINLLVKEFQNKKHSEFYQNEKMKKLDIKCEKIKLQNQREQNEFEKIKMQHELEKLKIEAKVQIEKMNNETKIAIEKMNIEAQLKMLNIKNLSSMSENKEYESEQNEVLQIEEKQNEITEQNEVPKIEEKQNETLQIEEKQNEIITEQNEVPKIENSVKYKTNKIKLTNTEKAKYYKDFVEKYLIYTGNDKDKLSTENDIFPRCEKYLKEIKYPALFSRQMLTTALKIHLNTPAPSKLKIGQSKVSAYKNVKFRV